MNGASVTLVARRPSVLEEARTEILALMDRFGRHNVVVELTTQLLPTDDEDNDALADLAAGLRLPVVATTGAHYATPQASRLGAAMAAVRGRRCARHRA